MTLIHFAVDHGGYELGRALQQRAIEGGFEVVWHGADELDRPVLPTRRSHSDRGTNRA